MGSVRANDTARESLIVIQCVRRQISKFNANPVKLREISEPMAGFRWGRKLIIPAGTPAIDDLMSCIDGPKTPPETIVKQANVCGVLSRRILSPPCRIGASGVA